MTFWQFTGECPYSGPRAFEVPYVLDHLIDGTTIEIGGNNSLFKWAFIRRGHPFTLIDPIGTNFNNGNNHRFATCLKGDIRKHTAEQLGCFDNVILVSVLEHIGLPAYGQPKSWEGSPRQEQRRAFDHCMSFVKPQGRMICTIPYGAKKEEEDPEFLLRYNREMLSDLQNKYKLIDEKFFVLTKPFHFDRFRNVPDKVAVNRRANVCFVVEKL